MKHKIVLGTLYFTLFLGFALLAVARQVVPWISTSFGSSWLLACIAAYATVLLGLVRLINKLHRDRPSLTLPPAPEAAAGGIAAFQDDMFESSHQIVMSSSMKPPVEQPAKQPGDATKNLDN